MENHYIRLVRGAGVEIEKFLPKPVPKGIPLVILPARMLWDKGVGEFVCVARRIKAQKVKALFILVGDVDLHNPASVTQAQIDNWVASGVIEQWTRRDNMEKVYLKTSIVCLPSYNEGLPKVLLEATSCSRPVVTFDIPGCREVVKNGINGYLVKARSAEDLSRAMIRMLDNPQVILKMGIASREIAETQFNVDKVNELIIDKFEQVTIKKEKLLLVTSSCIFFSFFLAYLSLLQ